MTGFGWFLHCESIPRSELPRNGGYESKKRGKWSKNWTHHKIIGTGYSTDDQHRAINFWRSRNRRWPMTASLWQPPWVPPTGKIWTSHQNRCGAIFDVGQTLRYWVMGIERMPSWGEAAVDRAKNKPGKDMYVVCTGMYHRPWARRECITCLHRHVLVCTGGWPR